MGCGIRGSRTERERGRAFGGLRTVVVQLCVVAPLTPATVVLELRARGVD